MAYLNTSAQQAYEAANRANGILNNTSAQQAKEAGARQVQYFADAAAKAKPVVTKPVVIKPVVTKPVVAKPVVPVVPKLDKPKADKPKVTVEEKLTPEETAPIIQEMQSQGYPQIDIEARINALNEAKQAQAVANLGKSRDAQLYNLTSEESGIKPMYYDKRNMTAASNMMGRRTLAEELAARGETKSGVADQANINANMSLQGETGLLNRQEASDISDIARRRTGVQNAYESDVTSARAGFEAQAMQNLIDQYNADRQFKLQESGVTGSYNGGQTLQAQGQTFDQGMATKQFDQATKQQKIDNLYRDNVFDYQKSRDVVGDTRWQQTMNLDLRQQTFSETQAQISNALASKRISQDDAAQSLQWARFNAEQDPNSLDNQYKQKQIDTLGSKTNTGTTSTVDDFASTINSIYVVKPSAANGYQSSMDTTGVKSYLDKLLMAGVDESIVDSLAARYGVQ